MAYTTQQIKDILVSCADTCILPYFRNLADDQVKVKTFDHDIVTIADQEAEAYLTPRLSALVSGSVVLGEEAFSTNNEIIADIHTQADVWIIDPVDGTLNFRNGNDDFCTILAHAHKGVLVGAWIYAPVLNRFAAWRQGEAVTIDGKAVQFDTQPKAIDQMKVLDCMSWNRPDDHPQIVKNLAVFGHATKCFCFGVETIHMLENKFDAAAFGAGNPWDIAPCVAMVTASGGTALKLNGASVTGENLFTTKGAFFATRSPDQWQEVRDLFFKDVAWEKYFD